jgi:predicted dehydrogenase
VAGSRGRLLHRIAGRERFVIHAFPRRYMTPHVDELVRNGALGRVEAVEVTMASRESIAPPEAIRGLASHAFTHFAGLVSAGEPVRVSASVWTATGERTVGSRAFAKVGAEGFSDREEDRFEEHPLIDSRAAVRLRLRIIGSEGSLEILLLGDDDTAPPAGPPGVLRRGRTGDIETVTLQPVRTLAACYEVQMRVVSQLLRTRGSDAAGVSHELATVDLLDAAYESNATSAPVVVDRRRRR